jgi:hypothetical protein
MNDNDKIDKYVRIPPSHKEREKILYGDTLSTERGGVDTGGE